MPLAAYLCLYFIPSCTLSSTCYLPLVCPLSPLEPHWNLIGTSLELRHRITITSPYYLRRIYPSFACFANSFLT